MNSFFHRFLTIHDNAFDNSIIVNKMKALYDNFEALSSIDERFTTKEKEEQDEFIAELLKSPVMK